MIANISSSVTSSDVQNRANRDIDANGHSTSLCRAIARLRSATSVRCGRSVLICIVSTLLPVTITLLLIVGFIMQKSNLHEYAIYTFVIFCLAFIFPFVLFFFIVVLNKVFKLYKRLTNTSARRRPGSGQSQRHSDLRLHPSTEHNYHHICHNLSRDSNNFYINNLSLINVSVSQEIPLDDEPPSYEMALLCPSVQLTATDKFECHSKDKPSVS